MILQKTRLLLHAKDIEKCFNIGVYLTPSKLFNYTKTTSYSVSETLLVVWKKISLLNYLKINFTFKWFNENHEKTDGLLGSDEAGGVLFFASVACDVLGAI